MNFRKRQEQDKKRNGLFESGLDKFYKKDIQGVRDLATLQRRNTGSNYVPSLKFFIPNEHRKASQMIYLDLSCRRSLTLKR